MKISLSTTMCEEKKVHKERLEAIMKFTDFSRKTFIVSGALWVIILFGACYFSAASSVSIFFFSGIYIGLLMEIRLTGN